MWLVDVLARGKMCFAGDGGFLSIKRKNQILPVVQGNGDLWGRIVEAQGMGGLVKGYTREWEKCTVYTRKEGLFEENRKKMNLVKGDRILGDRGPSHPQKISQTRRRSVREREGWG